MGCEHGIQETKITQTRLWRNEQQLESVYILKNHKKSRRRGSIGGCAYSRAITRYRQAAWFKSEYKCTFNGIEHNQYVGKGYTIDKMCLTCSADPGGRRRIITDFKQAANHYFGHFLKIHIQASLKPVMLSI